MATTASTTFGALLRQHRLKAGLTQEGLAERAGVSARGVQDLERGLRVTPRAETVRLLADALELDPESRSRLIAAAHPELAISPQPGAIPLPLGTERGRGGRERSQMRDGALGEDPQRFGRATCLGATSRSGDVARGVAGSVITGAPAWPNARYAPSRPGPAAGGDGRRGCCTRRRAVERREVAALDAVIWPRRATSFRCRGDNPCRDFRKQPEADS
jgi:transcriptional regulator with XRE-family HTH domain